MKPGAVVPICSVANDHWNFARPVTPAAGDFEAPAAFPTKPGFWRGDKQVKREFLLVRKDQVVITIVVDVHETKAVVTALGIDNRSVWWQGVRQRFPRFFLLRPGKGGVLGFIANDQLATSIVVQIAQANPAIALPAYRVARRGQDRFPIDDQPVQQWAVFDPLGAVEAPRLCDGLVPDQRADVTIGMNDPEFHAGFLSIPLRILSDQGHGKAGRDPFALLRIPNASLRELLVGGNHIQVTVMVQVDEPNAVVLAVVGAQRAGGQKVPVEPILGIAEVEELHFAAVFPVCIVNELHELFGTDPAVWMKDKGEHPLLEHRCVQRGFPVGDGGRVVRPVGVVGLPVARDHGREFPAEFADDIRIGIILDRGAKPFQAEFGDGVRLRREIFAEPPVRVQRLLAGQRPVVGRGEVHHRGIDGQKPACCTDAIEDIRVKARAGTVH